jgi:hypothetical protein
MSWITFLHETDMYTVYGGKEDLSSTVNDVDHYVIIKNLLNSIFSIQLLDKIMEILQILYTFLY